MKPKRKKCWLCSRTRAAKFFPAHNKIHKVTSESIKCHPAKSKAMQAYIHITLRIEPQELKALSVCIDCLEDVHAIMAGLGVEAMR